MSSADLQQFLRSLLPIGCIRALLTLASPVFETERGDLSATLQLQVYASEPGSPRSLVDLKQQDVVLVPCRYRNDRKRTERFWVAMIMRIHSKLYPESTDQIGCYMPADLIWLEALDEDELHTTQQFFDALAEDSDFLARWISRQQRDEADN